MQALPRIKYKLPPKVIMQGLYAVGISVEAMAHYYGTTTQAIYYAFYDPRCDWKRKVALPKTKFDHGKCMRGHYPPQSVLDTWRQQGKSPWEMMRLCENLWFHQPDGHLH